MILPITLTTCAAAAILTIWMSMRTGRLRQKTGVMFGHGENDMIYRRMRAQLNFVESAPFILALIAVIEISGKGGSWLYFVSAIYILARVLHPLGMDKEGVPPTRMIGTIVTLLTLLGLAVMAVLIASGMF